MAEDKKGFLMYADQREQFDQLTDEQAGKLIKHLFMYVNDEHPQTDDIVTKLSFTPIKSQLKRDLEKWDKTLEGRSKAGKASVEARKLKGQQLYVLECWNDKERFLKIGVTSESVTRRYSSATGLTQKMPYNYSIVCQYFYSKDGVNPFDLESELHSRYNTYKPKTFFAGHTECINIKFKDLIVSDLTISTKGNIIQQGSTNPTDNVTVTVSDTVTDTDNGTVSVIVKEEKKETPKKEYGKTEINEVINYLTEKLGVTLDGTVKVNRNMANHLINKIKKDYPNKDPVANIKILIDKGLKDNFHGKNITGFQYIYNNLNKIINSIKNEKGKQPTDDELAQAVRDLNLDNRN